MIRKSLAAFVFVLFALVTAVGASSCAGGNGETTAVASDAQAAEANTSASTECIDFATELRVSAVWTDLDDGGVDTAFESALEAGTADAGATRALLLLFDTSLIDAGIDAASPRITVVSSSVSPGRAFVTAGGTVYWILDVATSPVTLGLSASCEHGGIAKVKVSWASAGGPVMVTVE